MENDKSRKNKTKSKNYIEELLTKYGRRKGPNSGKSGLENLVANMRFPFL